MRFLPYKCCWVVLMVTTILTGCNTSDERDQLYPNDEEITANTLETEDENYPFSDRTHARIAELADVARVRLSRVDQWQQTATNIPDDARLRLEELRKDLVRLKTDLENSLDSLDNLQDESSREVHQEMGNKIQRSRDELEQIDEELNEWHEDNIDI